MKKQEELVSLLLLQAYQKLVNKILKPRKLRGFFYIYIQYTTDAIRFADSESEERVMYSFDE